MFKKSFHTIICVNTHFDFDVTVQTESAKLIMTRLSHLPSHVPVILVGDFNALPQSPCYNIFTGQGQKIKAKESGFLNVFEKPFPGTQHNFTGDPNGDHIDWILYRGRIVNTDYMVIRDTIHGLYPSDHFPMYATFQWEN
jgi:endonuclease/exonuclease/phosphatase family metal-dependent hydrolase